MPFDAKVQHRDAGTIVALSGELDLYYAPGLRATLMSLTDAIPLVIDLQELVFIDASGLSVLWAVQHETPFLRLVRSKRRFVNHVFELTALTEFFKFFDSPNQAFNTEMFGSNSH